MRVVTLDFETFFDKDYTLSKMGPIEYIRDSRFNPLCVAIRENQGETVVFEDDIKEHLLSYRLDQSDCITVGHNIAGFDGLVLSEYFGIHPHMIVDTVCMARWCGIARMVGGTHAKVTEWLKNGKKEAGTVVSLGKRTREEFTPEEWAFFKQYCHDDTEQCSKNFYKMLPYMTNDALKLMSVTAKMATDPVLELDPFRLYNYIVELNAETDASMERLEKLFQFGSREEFKKNVRSAAKFVSMLSQLGVEAPMKVSEAKSKTAGKDVLAPALSKNDLEFTALLEHENPDVRLLVQTRLEQNSSIELTRATRLYNMSLTGRPMPVMLQTFGAHTGRYAAGNSEGATDGTNTQNLSKRQGNLTIRKSICAPKGYKIIACDSSQIEARMLAYLARQDDLVEQFREGRDPYSELAEKIFNVPWQDIKAGAKGGDKKMKMYRNVGKTAILSSGFGVSSQKFSDTLLRQNIKLDDDPRKHLDMATHAHSVYRYNNNMIVGFWRKCQKVVEHMVMGGSGSFAGPEGVSVTYGPMELVGSDKLIPSIKLNGANYILRYPNVRSNGTNPRGMTEYVFDGMSTSFKPAERRIYGCSVCENITQALAFQLLQWQACRMADAGLHIIANIHDCWVSIVKEADVEQSVKLVEQIMSSVPEWLPGFPVGCEAEVGDDYTIA